MKTFKTIITFICIDIVALVLFMMSIFVLRRIMIAEKFPDIIIIVIGTLYSLSCLFLHNFVFLDKIFDWIDKQDL